jgi:hypothetical protein
MKIRLLSFKIIPIIFLAASVDGCYVSPEKMTPGQGSEMTKIKFLLDNIDENGLRGPTNGLVAVSYEFCVPADERAYQEVLKIDPSLKISPSSRGRIGCATNQALCIGVTHQPRWREVLQQLSTVKYVTEISESFFE